MAVVDTGDEYADTQPLSGLRQGGQRRPALGQGPDESEKIG